MARFFWVCFAGGVGTGARYLLSGWVQRKLGPAFPLGTLAVNVLGCLVIGLLSQLGESRGALTPETRAFFVIGVLGGFTTFSSFGNETMNLWRDGESFLGFLNIAGQLVLGLGAVWLGRFLGNKIWG